MKAVWYNLRLHALQEAGSTRIAIDQTGYILEIFEGYPTSSGIAQQTMRDFMAAVNNILPIGCTADDFAAGNIVDYDVPQAAHQQSQNAVWIDPIRDAVYTKLLDPTETKHRLFDGTHFNAKAVEKWLVLDETILRLLLVVFILTSGVCVRGFQFKSFRFQKSDTHNRNVWLLRTGIFVFANPNAKQRHIKLAPTLHSFPSSITKQLAFYIYIIRPSVIRLLSEMGKEPPEPYTYTIWAYITPRHRSHTKLEWKGSDVNQALKSTISARLGTILHVRLARQINQAIFRNKYPAMFQSLTERSPLESSNGIEPLKQYGLHCKFPNLTTMDAYQAVKLLAVSEIWQAGLAVGPLNDAWQLLAAGSHLFPTETHLKIAFLHARHMIHIHYGVAHGLAESGKLASELLETKPFLYGQQVSCLSMDWTSSNGYCLDQFHDMGDSWRSSPQISVAGCSFWTWYTSCWCNITTLRSCCV
jgi:hypothetical protein